MSFIRIGDFIMKLEQNEKQLLFSETVVPDIFFAEYLPQLPGDYMKIYFYMVFLSKYKKDIKINDMSKKLSLPLKTINDGLKFLEENKLILKKTTGYIIIDLQEATLIIYINLILLNQKKQLNKFLKINLEQKQLNILIICIFKELWDHHGIMILIYGLENIILMSKL